MKKKELAAQAFRIKTNQTFDGTRLRSEARLVIPRSGDPEASDAAVGHLIRNWLIPRLLEEFLIEKGITPKSRFSPKSQY